MYVRVLSTNKNIFSHQDIHLLDFNSDDASDEDITLQNEFVINKDFYVKMKTKLNELTRAYNTQNTPLKFKNENMDELMFHVLRYVFEVSIRDFISDDKWEGRFLIPRGVHSILLLSTPQLKRIKQSNNFNFNTYVKILKFNPLSHRQSSLIKRVRSPAFLAYTDIRKYSQPIQITTNNTTYIFTRYEVPGDGNCLLNAIIKAMEDKALNHQLTGNNIVEKAEELRQMILDEVKQNDKMLKSVLQKQWQSSDVNSEASEIRENAPNAFDLIKDNVIKELSDREEYKGDVVKFLIAEYYNIYINTVQNNMFINDEYEDPAVSNVISLYYQNENHYQWLELQSKETKLSL